MTDAIPFDEQVDRFLNGEMSDAEKDSLAEQLDSDPMARKTFVEHVEWDTRLASALQNEEINPSWLGLPAAALPQPLAGAGSPSHGGRVSGLWWLLLTTSLFAIGLALFWRSSEPAVARITGVSGSLQWTGDGGQVVRDVTVGTSLSGGTVEGMAPDSWFELQFTDGSTVTISGNSVLTFSDDEQKVLHLKQGYLSGHVQHQPKGRPMLIHTRSALLEVVGTRFDVEAQPSSTMLHVAEGKVRVKRLSDGSVVDVPSQHRAIAAAGQILTSARVPQAVSHWVSEIGFGPEGTYGQWIPSSADTTARLRAIPFSPPENPSFLLAMAGMGVSRKGGSPVLLQPNSKFIVRGRVRPGVRIYFGIQVNHANGEFAGKFRTDATTSPVDADHDFEAAFTLNDFALDPCVRDKKDELPTRPDNLLLSLVWCFTQDQTASTGLEITEIELVSPEPTGVTPQVAGL